MNLTEASRKILLDEGTKSIKLKGADFGAVRVALSDARLWMNFLKDVFDGKIDLSSESSVKAIQKQSKELRDAIKHLEMTRKKYFIS